MPAYNIVHNILTNPIYAGAYTFGRTKSLVRMTSFMIILLVKGANHFRSIRTQSNIDGSGASTAWFTL